jgi:hypothetical protein
MQSARTIAITPHGGMVAVHLVLEIRRSAAAGRDVVVVAAQKFLALVVGADGLEVPEFGTGHPHRNAIVDNGFHRAPRIDRLRIAD